MRLTLKGYLSAIVFQNSEARLLAKLQKAFAVSIDYDLMAQVYDELYSSEQEAKYDIVLRLLPLKEPVLDVGCGTGLLLRLLPCYSVGLDISAGMLQIARQRAGGADLVRADAQRMPFRDECFQTILSITVVHEVPSMVEEIVRTLKPDGSAAITLLKKNLNLLQLILAKLAEATVYDFEELKDMVIVFQKPLGHDARISEPFHGAMQNLLVGRQHRS